MPSALTGENVSMARIRRGGLRAFPRPATPGTGAPASSATARTILNQETQAAGPPSVPGPAPPAASSTIVPVSQDGLGGPG